MGHGLCIYVLIVDEQELRLAKADFYNGMVSKNDVMWTGPLSVGDHLMLMGFEEALIVQKLVHWPDESHPLGTFEFPFTEVFFHVSKETIDQILLDMPEAWERNQI